MFIFRRYCSILLLFLSILFKTEGSVNHLHSGSRSLLVSPIAGEDCSGKEPCFTLSDYLEDRDDWFTSDTTFLFLPGNHTVNKHTSLVIQRVENLAMRGISDSSGVPAARIHCNGKLEFQFMSIRNLSISDMEFIECGLDKPTAVGGMPAAIRCAKVYDLMIRNVNIHESYGYGMVGANILGMSAIVDCIFSSNGWRATKSRKPMGGNAIFLFADSYSGASLAHSFNITDCEFANGTATKTRQPFMGPLELGGGSGLGLFIYHNNYNSYNLSISISECYFHDNVAPTGANMLIVADLVSEEDWSYLYTVTITNCDFYNGKATSEGGAVYIDSFQGEQIAASLIIAFINSTFQHNSARRGGALFVRAKRTKKQELDGIIGIRIENSQFNQNKASEGGSIYGKLTALLSYSAETHITQADAIHFNITECVFSQNQATSSGGSIHLLLDPGDIKGPDDPYYIAIKYNLLTNVTIFSCLFNENIAETGSAIIINGNEKEILRFVSANFLCYQANVIYYIIIQNTTFQNNSCTRDVACRSESAVLHLHNVQDCRLINSQFTDNRVGAIYANTSYLYLHGSINFTGNVARLGGTFHLECSASGQSIVHLSTMYISNNRATQYGGAIAVEDNCVHYSACFFQMPSIGSQTDLVLMENNTAEIAGDSVYGGSLESCVLLDSVNHTQTAHNLNHSLFYHTFGLSYLYSESVISSSPYQVCLCTSGSVGDECKTSEHREAYPGEIIMLSAATTGQYRGASPAIVRSTVKTLANEAWELGQRQEIQALGRKCGNLSYLILTLARYVEVHLQVESSQGSQQLSSMLSITFKDCPLGFELSEIRPYVCICAPHLAESGVRCNIDTQTFQYQGNSWIGKQSDNVAIHKSCPFDYCKPDFSDINLWNQDEQCANNRSGVLCGRCAPGLSMVLGSTRCLKCSNYYLFLIIPFAVAGVLLVLMLFCCNLTISTGTINGLIFYANIVWRNQSIFFPQGHPNFFIHFSRIFTAWLNLDLGIETCFCSGLDNYTKTWLQFLFPLYTWVLAGSIVYLHKRSVFISKVFTSNTLPILSTLLLMSYAKILSAAFDAVSSVSVTTKNGTSSLLWLLDGNASFFKGRHIPLFGMALVAILLYVTPFTMLLLLAPCLQARSDKKWLRWISKCKPFLDSYQAPYKDKFRYWPGLMLLIRLALFILFSANSLGDPRLNLFAVIIVVSVIPTILYCYNTGGVYEKHLVHLVETFFLLNLGIFTTASLFLRLSKAVPSKQVYLTSVMIGSAFVVFSFILAYHFYRGIKTLAATVWLMKYLGLWKQKPCEITCAQQSNSDITEQHHTVTVIELQLY